MMIIYIWASTFHYIYILPYFVNSYANLLGQCSSQQGLSEVGEVRGGGGKIWPRCVLLSCLALSDSASHHSTQGKSESKGPPFPSIASCCNSEINSQLSAKSSETPGRSFQEIRNLLLFLFIRVSHSDLSHSKWVRWVHFCLLSKA